MKTGKYISFTGVEKLEQAISCMQTFGVSHSDQDAKNKVAIMVGDLEKIIKERN